MVRRGPGGALEGAGTAALGFPRLCFFLENPWKKFYPWIFWKKFYPWIFHGKFFFSWKIHGKKKKFTAVFLTLNIGRFFLKIIHYKKDLGKTQKKIQKKNGKKTKSK